jgi:hypothetical protein
MENQINPNGGPVVNIRAFFVDILVLTADILPNLIDKVLS